MQLITDETLLRRPCEPVTIKEAGEIARRLNAFLERNNRRAVKRNRQDVVRKGVSPPALKGIGLSAPQLGILKRVTVIRCPGLVTTLVNPVILEHSPVTFTWDEMCLSLPGVKVTTRRWAWVKVQSDNWLAPRVFGPTEWGQWTPDTMLQSVVLQHEIDHLSGTTIKDRVAKDEVENKA